MKNPSLGDRVRIRPASHTVSLGLAGKIGLVYGITTPSVTSVNVIGDTTEDRAINVKMEDDDRQLWFAPELVEFVDHAAGTAIKIGQRQVIREGSGEWREYKIN